MLLSVLIPKHFSFFTYIIQGQNEILGGLCVFLYCPQSTTIFKANNTGTSRDSRVYDKT